MLTVDGLNNVADSSCDDLMLMMGMEMEMELKMLK